MKRKRREAQTRRTVGRAPRLAPKGPVPLRWKRVGQVLGLGPPLAAVLVVFLTASQCTSLFASVAVPGAARVSLGPGGYSVFYRYPERMAWSATPEVAFEVHAIEGPEVVLSAPRGETSYTFASWTSVVLNDFRLGRAGSYELDARFAGAHQAEDIVVGIGRGPDDRAALATILVLGIVVGVAVWLASLVLLVRYVRGRYDPSLNR